MGALGVAANELFMYPYWVSATALIISASIILGCVLVGLSV